MEKKIPRQLLEDLEQACNIMTKGYQMQTGNKKIQFGVLQFKENVPYLIDIVRQAAMLYDEYQGNEDYIHIPDVSQMLYNLRNYPVVGVWDKETEELEGVVTIKYHENTTKEKIDPYYPKEGVKFFSITGVMVKQREGMLNKGLGTNLYAASILGIQRYANRQKDKKIEMNVVIDCTNLPSLYALNSATQNLKVRGLVGWGMELRATLDAVYTVRDEKGHLVEAPTYVVKIPLVPQKARERKQETIFSYTTIPNGFQYKQYEKLLDIILERIKQDERCMVTQMKDEGTRKCNLYSCRKFKNLFRRYED